MIFNFRKRRKIKSKERIVVNSSQTKKKKKVITFSIDKRQKFVIGVAVLAFGLFFTEFQFGKSGFAVLIAVALSILTDIVLYWAIRGDLKNKFSFNLFILPLMYSFAFSLFYFLVPTRILFRLILTGLYSFGLYSLFLSQNIYIVSSIRTIALLSGARIVSFVLTLISYFFLTNILYTFHLPLYVVVPLFALYSFALVYQSLYSYISSEIGQSLRLWSGAVAICLVQCAVILWFWPSSPTIIALFLTGFFYTLVGLSHVWLEKRLFRGVLWEYIWVGVIVFFVLNLFTSWGK